MLLTATSPITISLDWNLRNNYRIYHGEHWLYGEGWSLNDANSKTIDPLSSLTYLGILWDTSASEIRILSEKINRIFELMQRDLLELIGHFNFDV